MDGFQNIDLKALARKAMGQYGFETSFPEAVIKEVDALNPGSLVEVQKGDVKDLRPLLWSSIDNNDSMDLDQIEYCERGQNGELRVKVAIADVDLFAPKGSAADGHAHQNTTSVYTGLERFPMFPDRMSTDLSSLKAGEDRLAVVVEFSVLANEGIEVGDVYRALVRNKAKLVYEEVGAWLEGKRPPPKSVSDVPGLQEQLKLQDEAAQKLGDYRTEKGSIELGTIEAKAVVRQENVADLVVVEHNRAHELIENFMIGANGVISGFLEAANIPIIQRVVRIPRDWGGIVEVAKTHGKALPANPDAVALSRFLAAQRKADPERFPDLSLTIVKLLGAGEYVMLEPNAPHIGHFCLAVTDYTHATAPNRRYVDIVVQRLIKAVLNRAPCPYAREELTAIAAWCTDKEKASKKVERFMRKAEASVLLAGKVGQSFDAYVTGASEKGTYVRLIRPPAEGRVMRGADGLKVGQKVTVKLIYLDPTRGFIDFEQVRGR